MARQQLTAQRRVRRARGILPVEMPLALVGSRPDLLRVARSRHLQRVTALQVLAECGGAFHLAGSDIEQALAFLVFPIISRARGLQDGRKEINQVPRRINGASRRQLTGPTRKHRDPTSSVEHATLADAAVIAEEFAVVGGIQDQRVVGLGTERGRPTWESMNDTQP